MDDRARRAGEARQKILESGDPELIRRLYLMEAARAPRAGGRPGPGLAGAGLALAGGAWLGTVLAGATLSVEMRQAFAAVAEEMGFEPAELRFAGSGGLPDGSLPDELGLGDLGDLSDFFDA